MPSEPLTFTLQLAGAQAVMSGLGQMVGAFGALRTVAIGALAAVQPLRVVLNEVGRMNDVSARIGSTVRDVVALERAFTAAGLAASEVPAYIARVQRALGGVNEEGTATAVAFDRLGLNMQSLRLQGPIEQLEAISAALARLPDQAARARAVQDIFGRGGQALLPLLSDRGALPGARADTAALGAAAQRNAARDNAEEVMRPWLRARPSRVREVAVWAHDSDVDLSWIKPGDVLVSQLALDLVPHHMGLALEGGQALQVLPRAAAHRVALGDPAVRATLKGVYRPL